MLKNMVMQNSFKKYWWVSFVFLLLGGCLEKNVEPEVEGVLAKFLAGRQDLAMNPAIPTIYAQPVFRDMDTWGMLLRSRNPSRLPMLGCGPPSLELTEFTFRSLGHGWTIMW
jgi:hypothetical protein